MRSSKTKTMTLLFISPIVFFALSLICAPKLFGCLTVAGILIIEVVIAEKIYVKYARKKTKLFAILIALLILSAMFFGMSFLEQSKLFRSRIISLIFFWPAFVLICKKHYHKLIGVIREPVSVKAKIILSIASVSVFVGAYSYLSYKQHQKNPRDTTIPTYSQLKEGVKKLIQVNEREEVRYIVVDSKATLIRFFAGMIVSVGIALALGFVIGCFKHLEAFSNPILGLMAAVPPTAALAVFFVVLGIELSFFIAVIAVGVVPAVSRTIVLAIDEIPAELLFKTQTLRASPAEMIWNVIVKICLPKVLDTIRLQIYPAMVYLIAAEMVCGGVGWGYRIRISYRRLDMSVVYPCLLLIAAFSIGIDLFMRAVNKGWCPWYFKLPKKKSFLARLKARFFGGGLRILSSGIGGVSHGN